MLRLEGDKCNVTREGNEAAVSREWKRVLGSKGRDGGDGAAILEVLSTEA